VPEGRLDSDAGPGRVLMMTILLTSFALMLVIEGVLPFLMPGLWRQTFRKLTEMSDGQIRFIGLTSMLAGLLLLYIVRH
jgi:uncharacterized protein YjeT (DUF2065 family)